MHDRAYALVVLQIALAILNIRGACKNEPKNGMSRKRRTWWLSSGCCRSDSGLPRLTGRGTKRPSR